MNKSKEKNKRTPFFGQFADLCYYYCNYDNKKAT